MKDVASKIWRPLLGVLAGVVGLYLIVLEWSALKFLAVATKDNTWGEIAAMTLASVLATYVLFKVEWWVLDKIVVMAKKVIASRFR
jgi:presenilin-like A22 family membrane protease